MNPIRITAFVKAPVEVVWQYFTEPEHIMQWNQASADWHCPKASSDLVIGGRFSYTMAAKDGSFSFDLCGIFTEIIENKSLSYILEDGRKVFVNFESVDEDTEIIEIFEPETQNPIEMQEKGWQAILDCFKYYVEAN